MAGAVTGLNHITLAVTDLARSIAFYRDVLGATPKAEWAKGAYLELGTIWLCLSLGPVRKSEDYTHIALSCAPEDFPDLVEGIRAIAPEWQSNHSEGASHYFLDPDGHKLELHLGDLESRLAHYRAATDLGVTVHD